MQVVLIHSTHFIRQPPLQDAAMNNILLLILNGSKFKSFGCNMIDLSNRRRSNDQLALAHVTNRLNNRTRKRRSFSQTTGNQK